MAKINKNVPCYGCERRCVTSDYNCHSDCPEYKAYKQERDERAELIRSKKAEETMIDAVRFATIQKVSKDKMKQSPWKG